MKIKGIFVCIPFCRENPQIVIQNLTTVYEKCTIIAESYNINFVIAVYGDGVEETVIDDIQTQLNNNDISAQNHFLFAGNTVNHGKGHALKTMIANLPDECADWVVFTMDVDLSTDMKAINDCIDILQKEDIDFLYGNRINTISQVENKSLYRKFISNAAYKLICKTVGLNKLADTQCGFKCYRTATIAKELNALIKSEQFEHDIELFYYVIRNGYVHQDVSVIWNESDIPTNVHAVKDSIQCLKCVHYINSLKKKC